MSREVWRQQRKTDMTVRHGSVRKQAFVGAVRQNLVFCFLLLAMLAGPASCYRAFAQEVFPASDQTKQTSNSLDIATTNEDGFGRVILTFTGLNLLPEYSIKQDNSIFVLRFSNRIQADAVSAISRTLIDYVSVSRQDPDGKGIRIALKQGVRINTIEAGERLFIDFLPKDWSGLPPSLPEHVVTELAKRAEEALRLARSLEQSGPDHYNRPKLDIRLGDHPTFSRLAFIWNMPFDSTYERQGGAVNLYFNHDADIDLAPLRASLPSLLQDIQATKEGSRLKFTLYVAKSSDVRAFREDNSYIVDITGDDELFGSAEAEEQTNRVISKAGDASILIDKGVSDSDASTQEQFTAPRLQKTQSRDDLIMGPGADGQSVDTNLFDSDQLSQTPISPSSAFSNNGFDSFGQESSKTDIPSSFGPPGSDFTGQDPLVVEKDGQHLPDMPEKADIPVIDVEAQTVNPKPNHGGNAEKMEGSGQDLSSMSLHVEAKTFGRSVRLFFPFKSPTAAAVFRKDGIIWAVFDTVLALDVASVQKHLSSIAEDIEVWRSGDIAVVRILLKNARLTTFSADGYGWLLTIGDMVVEPTQPLHMVRTKIAGDRSAMRVRIENTGPILQLRDPGTGETLHVVTAFGPARGFVKAQRFVDFSTMTSAHGIALTEYVDDLQVFQDKNYVYITSKSGLTLSFGRSPKLGFEALGDEDEDKRPSFLDLKSKIAKTPVVFIRERQDLERKVAKFDGLMAVRNETSLIKLLMANGYYYEALGHLRIVEQNAPELARRKGFQTLLSAADLFTDRAEAAYHRLSEPDFATDSDAAVWRGLAAARTGHWREAELAYQMVDDVIDDYSPKIQQMVMLDRVELAVLDQKFDEASVMLADVNPGQFDDESMARYNLLRGKVAVARNKMKEAFSAFKLARDSGYLPIANDAWLQDVKLRRMEKQIDDDTAIDELNGLTTIWRGDSVELRALRNLARLYVDKGQFRRAFETMKSAVASDPDSEISRILQEEMNAVFCSLFLDGKADKLPAIKALSLYYDFRELTPVGRRGDEMVRRLADRLVDVDLLDRAEELLNHQVENRLKGAARSQIAADLAVIYMLDSKPNLALDILRKTRQSQLPLSLERQRRLVEAKALAQLNKVDLAMDLVKPLEGDDVDQLRSDILWAAKRWQQSAEQIEMMMDSRWSSTTGLDSKEQMNVLRAGIGYSLADDKLGLDRLRQKYAKKMADTELAGAFDVVTMPIRSDETEFQAIANKIAGVDTMERFLEEYRERYAEGKSGEDASPALSQTEIDTTSQAQTPSESG